MTNSLKRAAMFCAVLISLAGCILIDAEKSTKHQQTVGQQLVDLKQALDAGAINQAEFDEQKARLLKPCDQD